MPSDIPVLINLPPDVWAVIQAAAHAKNHPPESTASAWLQHFVLHLPPTSKEKP